MAKKSVLALIACLILGGPLSAQDANPVVAEVEKYLNETLAKAERGTERYYGLQALDQALKAYKEGNYGIGSVVVVKWKDKVYEYRGRNAMVTGYRLRDHAEARALDRAVVHLVDMKGRQVSKTERARGSDDLKPDDEYEASTEYLRRLPDGLHVYGTLEPCPMCMVMMLNAGVKSSLSLAQDGELKDVNGQRVSDGGAMAIEEKFKGAPQVWQFIRAGQGLKFDLYRNDQQLSEFGRRIFQETRGCIDKLLASQQ